MGSVLSSAYAALCSFVNAQLDKVEMRRLMATYPQMRDMPAEEREDLQRWFRDQDALEAAVRLRGRDSKCHQPIRRNYRHPCYRLDADKNKLDAAEVRRLMAEQLPSEERDDQLRHEQGCRASKSILNPRSSSSCAMVAADTNRPGLRVDDGKNRRRNLQGLLN